MTSGFEFVVYITDMLQTGEVSHSMLHIVRRLSFWEKKRSNSCVLEVVEIPGTAAVILLLFTAGCL